MYSFLPRSSQFSYILDLMQEKRNMMFCSCLCLGLFVFLLRSLTQST